MAYVIGVDFGTLSGRAVVVRVSDGAEVGTAVHEYAHAVLEEALPDGTPLGPDWALQVPSDYVDVLRTAVPEAVRAAGIDAGEVIGIGTDFTQDQDEAFFDWLRHDKGYARRMVPSRGTAPVITGLENLAQYPNLTQAMERRGWSETRIRGVLGENWLRFLKQIWGA